MCFGGFETLEGKVPTQLEGVKNAAPQRLVAVSVPQLLDLVDGVSIWLPFNS